MIREGLTFHDIATKSSVAAEMTTADNSQLLIIIITAQISTIINHSEWQPIDTSILVKSFQPLDKIIIEVE